MHGVCSEKLNPDPIRTALETFQGKQSWERNASTYPRRGRVTMGVGHLAHVWSYGVWKVVSSNPDRGNIVGWVFHPIRWLARFSLIWICLSFLILNLFRTLSSWWSGNYRPSAPFLNEVASHVKKLQFRPILLLLYRWHIDYTFNYSWSTIWWCEIGVTLLRIPRSRILRMMADRRKGCQSSGSYPLDHVLCWNWSSVGVGENARGTVLAQIMERHAHSFCKCYAVSCSNHKTIKGMIKTRTQMNDTSSSAKSHSQSLISICQCCLLLVFRWFLWQ